MPDGAHAQGRRHSNGVMVLGFVSWAAISVKGEAILAHKPMFSFALRRDVRLRSASLVGSRDDQEIPLSTEYLISFLRGRIGLKGCIAAAPRP